MESQRLYEEREKLKSDLAETQARKSALGQDPDLRATVLALLVERALGVNPSRIQKLQSKMAGKKEALDQEERGIKARLRENTSALAVLTRPVIEIYIQKIRSERDLVKLDQTVLSRVRSGFSMINWIEISTNETGVLQISKIANGAIESLRTMESEPIARIDSFFQETMGALAKVDLEAHRISVNEIDYERSQFLTAPRNER